MAIDFPNSPTVGQIYTVGDKSWIWDGTVWKAYGASLSPTVLKVDTTNSRVGINNQSPTTALDVTGTVTARAASTQDGVALAGRAGGTGTYEVTLTPTTLTADRTLTLPDATGTVALTSDPGLVLVKTQDVGSAVSSVTVNNAFSSTYDNYRITWSNITCSTSNDMNLQLTSSGTAASTDYGRTNPYVTSGAVFTAGFVSAASEFFCSSTPSTSAKHVGHLDVFQPFLAQWTTFSGPIYQQRTDLIGIGVFGAHRVATSYDGFKLNVSTGTVTGGTIRVYGYRNS